MEVYPENMDRQAHWQNVYETKAVDAVSWFREHLDRSLEMIGAARLGAEAQIIDVGGGASTLVDDLLERGFTNVTVLDISAAALEKAKLRLGDRAESVDWITADITAVELQERSFDLWHDRAVFHFLISPDDRRRYLENLKSSLKPDGHVVLATFADDGPLKCSGLDVERYDVDKLVKTLGEEFTLIDHVRESHTTPFDTVQNFLYAHFVRS